MNQKERLEQIKRKHEEERKKKQIFYHRIIAVIIAAVIIILAVLLAWGSISFISHRIEEKRQRQAQIAAEEAAAVTPEPTPVVTINPYEISQWYYDNSAFIGNSFVDDLFTYDFLDNADYFCKIGLSVADAMTEHTATGNVPVIDELKSDKQYNKIFMMFGENELGWASSDSFLDQYGELIDKAKKYQPNAEIFLLSITPVTKKTSEADIDNTNNEQIAKYNELIRSLATEKGATYADTYKAVADKDGNLPDGAASDGVHFGKDYYKKCLLYIQNNYQ